jgi:hypothetical protein
MRWQTLANAEEKHEMIKKSVALMFAAVALLVMAQVALAHPPSGAIFTTVVDGSEVNFNHYPSKPDVYLDGGPGPGAPQTAAGLDDGTYVFQVTDPSGKNLLSTDLPRCRQFTVSNGIITGVVVTGCQHSTGTDIDHGAKTVQLIPYNDTPNPGGVYKVWVTTVENFLAGCLALGVPNGLDIADAGRTGGNAHGFVCGDSKTDNFKVGKQPVVEIDTRFFDSTTKQILDQRKVTWIDTNGAQNDKWSYYAPQLYVMHEAHVEGVETGVHQIVINDQPGATVEYIMTPDGQRLNGAQTVSVHVPNLNKEKTYWIDVYVRQ